MHLAGLILLILTLLLSGCYAGMAVMCQIGVLPAMRRLSVHAYADAWRAMDYYMERSMPPYKLTLLIVSLGACVVAGLEHRVLTASAAGASFLLSLVGLVLTIRKQLPLNARLKSLTEEVEESELLEIREQTVRNFAVRLVLAILAFAVVGVAVVVSPGC